MIKEFNVQIFNDYSYLQHTVVEENSKIYMCGYAAHSI